MKRTKYINQKVLGNIKCNVSVWDSYGQWIKIRFHHLVIAADQIIPSFRLITFFALSKFCPNFEIFRFTKWW